MIFGFVTYLRAKYWSVSHYRLDQLLVRSTEVSYRLGLGNVKTGILRAVLYLYVAGVTEVLFLEKIPLSACGAANWRRTGTCALGRQRKDVITCQTLHRTYVSLESRTYIITELETHAWHFVPTRLWLSRYVINSVLTYVIFFIKINVTNMKLNFITWLILS